MPTEQDPAAAQALAERVVHGMLDRDAFSKWLGIQIVSLRPNAVVVSMVVRDDMVNGFGVCHGGVTFSLADSALAFASNTHGHVTVSVDNGIRYPAPIRVGDELTAAAEQEGTSNRLAYFRVTVHNQHGAAVGLFRGTVYRTATPHFPDSTDDA